MTFNEYKIYKIQVGSKATSKTFWYKIISHNPEKAVAIVLNLSKNNFKNDDSVCVVDLIVENKNNKGIN